MLNKAYKAIAIEEIEGMIMNRILEIRDALLDGSLNIVRSPETIEDVLVDMDDDFAHWHKNVLDLRNQASTLEKGNGLVNEDTVSFDQGGMADMLNEQLESAESAYETRFLELKADTWMMERATEVLLFNQEHKEIVAQKRQELADQRAELIREEDELQRVRKELQRKKDNGWVFVYLMMLMNATHWINMQRKILSEQIQRQELKAKTLKDQWMSKVLPLDSGSSVSELAYSL